MRRFLIVLGVIVLALAGIMGITSFMSPSSEVVTLTSRDAQGEAHETALWVVDQGDEIWLRAGNPDNAWLQNLRANPEVELERGDATLTYRAALVEEAETREQINASMAEKYGASNSLVELFASHDQSVPIRLDPLPAVGSGARR